MSKTLSIILTIFKVVKIVAKVIFILCIVGGVGCLASLVLLPVVQMLPSEILPPEAEIQFPSAYIACVVGVVSCAAAAVTAYFGEKYFGNVENAGTPFTLDSSKECFRLGIILLITSAASTLISSILSTILNYIFDAHVFEIEGSLDLSAGLFLLFLSLIFKCGAELISEKKPCDQEEQSLENENAQLKSAEPAEMNASNED